ncbi:MAG: prepilin-type N-terminal cleavage/methylation domain-containing protein [Chromatiales bacterium]|nr:MAG: prepilin-type N-terminal cleavage/methylation domain-containing protein [Chromatiales bacterium]
MRQRIRGVTLYELLMTLALVGIVAASGLPAFDRMLARNRQTIEINALFHALHLARKESIMRRKVVSLCPSLDGRHCAADWSTGWIMFENSDRDSPPQVDEGEFVLRAHRVSGEVQIDANRRGFTLRATFLRATNGTFVVCDRRRRIPPKGLIVSYTGRPRVAFARPNGAPYACAD